jgi:hypothetical protein
VQDDRREVVNEVIPERNVQFRENRNQVLAAGDICTICGDVHSDNFILSERQPWEVAAPFVGAAVPGNGFFVIPDIRNAAPAKKIYQGVVEILEGDLSANQVEHEFTQWAGPSCNWRWYAKPMSAKKFLMRFPSARDIDAWVHFGRTNLRTIPNVVVKVVPWFPGYGATGDLDTAWFQVKGIPIDNRNCPVATYAGSTVGRTLAVDRHSLNNVDYVRILIGNLNVALVPPVVSNVNIGSSFYDLEFTREIPRGRPQAENAPVLVEQSDQNRPAPDRAPVAGHTPKRTRLDTSGNTRNVGNQSAPGGFMRDARVSYQASVTDRQIQVVQPVQESDPRGKRKATDIVPSVDSDEDDESSMGEKARMLGYGAPKQITGDSSTSRVSPAMDHYPAYLEYLARPRITDGVVENVGEPLQNELTYEEFLRDLLKSRSDKCYMWKKQLEKIPGAQLDPVIESPLDQSMDSANLSSQEADISSENGAADVPNTSTVRIIELPSSPVINAATRIRSSVPTIPTPEQPQPNRASTRIQAEGRSQISILEKAKQITKEKNLEGNVPINANSFSVLQDDVILDKALEIGIDAASLPLSTIHLLKDLELARDNLTNKQIIKSTNSKNVELEIEISGEDDTDLLDNGDILEEFTPVVSRRTKKNLKKLSGGKKSNQGVPLCGTKSLRKGSNNHPLCDIITGPRLRSHTTKYSK